MSELLRDFDAERALLASVLLQPSSLRGLLVDERLRPEHFSVETHGFAFDALVRIADRGDTPETVLFAAELESVPSIRDPREFVAQIAEQMTEAGGARGYARRVRDLHRRRELKLASALLSDAADQGDASKLAEVERLLSAPEDSEPSTWNGQELAERYADRLDEQAPESYSWPFEKLNFWTGGGLRRKQVVLIGGWTANGKSVFYDQVLEKLSEQGLRCHSYINEMSEQERMDRTVARLSGVPFGLVHSRRMRPEQEVDIRRCLTRIRVGMTECAGWTAPEIARHIRWNRWDVAGVDIVHEIAHKDERDLAEIAQILRTTAKSVNCALVACVHLNDQRVTSPQRPVPVLRDVRGTGMLTRGADIVLFIHREDDEDGVPKDTGVLFAAKIRNGQPSVMGVTFQADRMRFVPQAREEQ